MGSVEDLHTSIVEALVEAGRGSWYLADANESDPRYRSYGVRAAEADRVIAAHRRAIEALEVPDRLDLACRLVESEYGEQQRVALHALNTMTDHFGPEDLELVDGLVRHLHGWSKVDTFTGSFLATLLFAHTDPMLELVRSWNHDDDQWLRRASVALFTRKVAASGRFLDETLDLCDNLKWAPEELVQKAVGWALKDHLAVAQDRVIVYVAELHEAGVPGVVTNYALKNLSVAERRAILGRSR